MTQQNKQADMGNQKSGQDNSSGSQQKIDKRQQGSDSRSAPGKDSGNQQHGVDQRKFGGANEQGKDVRPVNNDPMKKSGSRDTF